MAMPNLARIGQIALSVHGFRLCTFGLACLGQSNGAA